MFESLAAKLASTAIAIGSLFFTSVVGTNASFTNPKIDVDGSKIVVTTQLENCFTEELDKIFQSGQRIRVYFRVSIHKKENNKPLLVKDFYHQIRYDLVDHYYQIYFSENDESMNAVTLNEAHDLLSRINRREVIDASFLKDGVKYYIQLSAFMKKIRLPGMKEEINLMSYWNSVEPAMKSASFDKSVLAL